eukprot:6796737-Alexandrium_andersonii.AAC.1
MVATIAGLDTIAPAADGNNGVAAAVPTSARASSTCASNAHVGQRAGSTQGVPPGRTPYAQVCVRVAPRPVGSVLETG